MGAHAVTLSPYMGWDSVRPFVTGEYANKGAFVLCKTSNASSNVSSFVKLALCSIDFMLALVCYQELQLEQVADGARVYEKVTNFLAVYRALRPTILILLLFHRWWNFA